MATSTPTPSRAAMLEVADYLDALERKSGLLARIALRAVSKTLRQRAPKPAAEAARRVLDEWEWREGGRVK